MRRDDVRLLVSTGCDEPVHARFHDLARFLQPGDLVVVNTSGTRAAAIDAITPRRRAPRAARLDRAARRPVAGGGAHARCPAAAPAPFDGDLAGATLTLAGGARAHLHARYHRLHPAVGGHPRRCHAAGAVPGAPRPGHPLQLRRAGLAAVGLPDRLRHRRRQRRDAVGRPPVHARGHHLAGRPRRRRHAAAAAHRRVVAGRPRAAVPGALPGAGRDGRAGERHPRRRPPGRRRRHHGRAGAGDGHRRRAAGPIPATAGPSWSSRPSGACGPSTGWSPAGTSRRRRTC